MTTEMEQWLDDLRLKHSIYKKLMGELNSLPVWDSEYIRQLKIMDGYIEEAFISIKNGKDTLEDFTKRVFFTQGPGAGDPH